MLAVNLRAPFRLCARFGTRMMDSDGGSITVLAAGLMRFLCKPARLVTTRLAVGPLTVAVLSNTGFMLPGADA